MYEKCLLKILLIFDLKNLIYFTELGKQSLLNSMFETEDTVSRHISLKFSLHNENLTHYDKHQREWLN